MLNCRTRNGNPQNPAQTNPPTDCERFVALVAGIASRHNSAEGFMDEMARTFTAANDSSIREMERTANTAVPRGRQIFGPANAPNAGFKAKFRDGSNQVRHFVGGLVAGYRLGVFVKCWGWRISGGDLVSLLL